MNMIYEKGDIVKVKTFIHSYPYYQTIMFKIGFLTPNHDDINYSFPCWNGQLGEILKIVKHDRKIEKVFICKSLSKFDYGFKGNSAYRRIIEIKNGNILNIKTNKVTDYFIVSPRAVELYSYEFIKEKEFKIT